jgi:RNA-directed DNA polymerase
LQTKLKPKMNEKSRNVAYKKVVANKGTSLIDEVTVEELGSYIRENKGTIINSLCTRQNNSASGYE